MLAATCDGASTNRRLVKVHDLKAKFIYKVQNVYAKDKRELFFFSDPPHLIKTTRNCWSSSARSLWVCHMTVYVLCTNHNTLFPHRTMVVTYPGHTW